MKRGSHRPTTTTTKNRLCIGSCCDHRSGNIDINTQPYHNNEDIHTQRARSHVIFCRRRPSINMHINNFSTFYFILVFFCLSASLFRPFLLSIFVCLISSVVRIILFFHRLNLCELLFFFSLSSVSKFGRFGNFVFVLGVSGFLCIYLLIELNKQTKEEEEAKKIWLNPIDLWYLSKANASYKLVGTCILHTKISHKFDKSKYTRLKQLRKRLFSLGDGCSFSCSFSLFFSFTSSVPLCISISRPAKLLHFYLITVYDHLLLLIEQ